VAASTYDGLFVFFIRQNLYKIMIIQTDGLQVSPWVICKQSFSVCSVQLSLLPLTSCKIISIYEVCHIASKSVECFQQRSQVSD